MVIVELMTVSAAAKIFTDRLFHLHLRTRRVVHLFLAAVDRYRTRIEWGEHDRGGDLVQI